MEKNIRFAVVGYGHIGKRHAAMIQQTEHCELVAIIDIAAVVAEEDLPGVHFYTGLDAFFESEFQRAVDVVSIATPNGLHAVHALQCLEQGKHVVLEKPIALHAADAANILEKASVVKKEVFPVMQNRYSLPARWLKELMNQQTLGAIYMVTMNCFWNRDERYYTRNSWHGTKQMDGGTLFTQFSHFIDLMYWCFGDITNIRSGMKNFNHTELTDFEDSGMVQFDFVNGGMGAIHFSTAVWNQNLESSIVVIGAFGSLKISGQYMDKVEYCHIKDYTSPILNVAPGITNHQYVYQNVVDVLQNKGIATASVAEGMAVVDIIERIYGA